MADSISFKAYLKRTGQEAEVRRFGIDTGAASSFVYLRSKIQTIFPSIQNDQFSIFWHDGDDFISIDTDEELVVALTNNPVQPIKLHVHVAAKSQSSAGAAGSYEPQAHLGVSCDGCDNGITGYRYKCVSCPDFDLCSRCEAKNLHPEHIMIRMSMPLSPHMRSKFFRKMFGRPHKFAKRFEHWNRESGCSGQAPPSGGCPFMREEGPQAAPGPKVSDMFDFSALMDFINTLGVVVDDKRPAEPTASASSSAQAQAQPGRESAPGASGSQPAPGAEYLTSVGQAIQAFLDPFGVNVSFDVRPPKASETAAASTPTAPTSTPTAPTSTPTASTSTPTASTSTPTATTSTAAATTSAAAATSTPTAPAPGFILPRAAATPAPATPVPAADQIWDAMMRDNYGAAAARRNSDDWTLVNRESPTRSEEAMAVDGEENRAARAGAVYPELPRETPAAAAASAPVDPEAQRVQDAIEKIRSMGFSIDPNILKELLSNQDIATVLEMLLGGGSGKK